MIKYEIKDYFIYLSMDYIEYRNKYADILRGIPGAHWDKLSRKWKIPLDETNIAILNEYMGISIGEVKVKPIEHEVEVVEYESPIKPCTHQIEAVSNMNYHKKFALFMEMGTGKTKCVVDWFILNNNKIRHLLVICPKSIIASWEEELTKHGITDYTILTGSNKQRLAKIEQGNKIFIINYEGVLSFSTRVVFPVVP